VAVAFISLLRIQPKRVSRKLRLIAPGHSEKEKEEENILIRMALLMKDFGYKISLMGKGLKIVLQQKPSFTIHSVQYTKEYGLMEFKMEKEN